MATIRKTKNGYLIRVSCGFDVNGKRILRSITYTPDYGMTNKQIEKELHRQAFLFEEECRKGVVLDGKIKFKDYAEQWIKTKQLKERTKEGYKGYLPRIYEAIGNVKLCDINKTMLESFYNNLAETGIRRDVKYIAYADIESILKTKGLTKTAFSKANNIRFNTVSKAVKGEKVDYSTAQKIADSLNMDLLSVFKPSDKSQKQLSTKTLQNYHRLISSILSSAVEDERIFDNPCRRAKLPKKSERPEPQYLTKEQAVKLFELLESEPLTFKTAITVLINSGLRRGELLGLCWADIDFDNCILDINKTVLYTPHKGIYIDTPKTRTSKRVIKVPQLCIDLLKEVKKEQAKQRLKVGDIWQTNDFVFTQWNGEVIHPDTLSAMFRKFMQKHSDELPPIKLHSLRHTHATLLIANNLNLKAVSSRLGHSNLTTTLNTYTHAIQSADALASDIIGDIFKKKDTADNQSLA